MDLATFDQLDYGIFQDAAHTIIWGDNTFGTTPLVQALPLTGNVTYNYTPYGRIFSGQYVTAGSYNDVLTVTLLF